MLEVEAGQLPALPDLRGQVLCGSRMRTSSLTALSPVFRIRIHRIHLPDPDQDQLVRGIDPDPVTFHL